MAQSPSIQNPSLSRLEHSIYRTVVDDGILDICIGLFILVMAFVLSTDIHLVGDFDAPALLMVLIPGVWWLLRRTVVEPRVGYVRLHADRMRQIRRSKKWLVIAFFFSAVGANLLLEIDAGWVDVLRESKHLVIGTVVAIPMLLAALFLDVKRWLGYVGVFFAGALVERIQGFDPGSSYYLTGSVVVVAGIVVLMGFLNRIPGSDDPEDTDA